MRSSVNFYKDSSNRKPATAYNPFMIGHVANELRHHKFSEDRMMETKVIVDIQLPGRVIIISFDEKVIIYHAIRTFEVPILDKLSIQNLKINANTKVFTSYLAN